MSSQLHAARAAVVRQAGGPFVIEDIQVESPREDEVLVRLVASGICHTDIVFRDGAMPIPMPIVLGHEGSGVVEAVGAKVSHVQPGDHVVLSMNSCGHCPNCEKKQPAYCFSMPQHNLIGTRPDGSSALSQKGEPLYGAVFYQSSFSTLAIAHVNNTVKVDKDLPLEILGPLGCGIQTGAGTAINSLKVQPGDSLAIFGGGAVGLSAMLGALAVGAGPVIVIEPNVERAKLAIELGAAHTINPKETQDVLAKLRELSGGGVTHAIDTTGIPAVMAVAVEAVLPNGMLALLGVPPAEATVPANMMSMLIRGVGVKYYVEGDSNPKEFIPRMIALYREGRFPFDRLIKQYPFAEINEAAHSSETGKTIKPVIVF
jgi:Zn-dependent alcohol dehydrogenase